jgi:riboflavin synthase
MFTGIIETTGRIVSNREKGSGAQLILNAGSFSKKVREGDSVAVNGVCLTVRRRRLGILFFDISPETWKLTNLSSYEKGDELNLELPLTPQTFLSGHFVQGHVDGVGRVKKWIRKGEDVRLFVEIPRKLIRYCIPKGSITLNGVSLTIASQDGLLIGVALIPYTLSHTNLDSLEPGDPVNVETDMIGRYVVSAVEKSYDKA